MFIFFCLTKYISTYICIDCVFLSSKFISWHLFLSYYGNKLFNLICVKGRIWLLTRFYVGLIAYPRNFLLLLVLIFCSIQANAVGSWRLIRRQQPLSRSSIWAWTQLVLCTYIYPHNIFTLNYDFCTPKASLKACRFTRVQAKNRNKVDKCT